jgi:hypothetical protein
LVELGEGLFDMGPEQEEGGRAGPTGCRAGQDGGLEAGQDGAEGGGEDAHSREYI